jgi:DNA repair protein RecN (Recombination protein N)
MLRAERIRLRSASRLADVAGSAAHRLTGGDPALCDELQRIAGEIGAVVDLDPALGEMLGLVQEAVTNLADAGRALERYAERIEANPGRLDEVEERLFRYEQLMRLHGPSEDDVLAARDRIRSDLDGLDRIDDELASLDAAFAAELARAGDAAFALSERRQAVAGALAKAIGDELAALGMGGARVQVDVARHEGGRGELEVRGARLSVDGVDRVEFLIAPNKGIAPQPLRKIASGGELSRSLLAIKRVLAAKGPAGLYVFDEVDAGVGGAVAERIGQALVDIARHRQVLCITHLAPIAALADAHFVVQKSQNGAVAKTEIRRVTGKDRVREVARMLSGAKVTKASIETAEELLHARR